MALELPLSAAAVTCAPEMEPVCAYPLEDVLARAGRGVRGARCGAAGRAVQRRRRAAEDVVAAESVLAEKDFAQLMRASAVMRARQAAGVAACARLTFDHVADADAAAWQLRSTRRCGT